jgi:hypothetical protein
LKGLLSVTWSFNRRLFLMNMCFIILILE